MDREKLVLKYSFQCEPRDLFIALTKPSYLQNWIAERVVFDPKSEVYTFFWRDFSESARIAEIDSNRYVKYEWIGGDHTDHEYVSFRIDAPEDDDLIDLHIEDFCDPGDEKQLSEGWDKQIQRLEYVVK